MFSKKPKPSTAGKYGRVTNSIPTLIAQDETTRLLNSSISNRPIPNVPRKGERIPALFLSLEDSNIFKLVICLGSEEVAVRLQLIDTYCPSVHSASLLEKKAAECVMSNITCQISLSELVDVVLHSMSPTGCYLGEVYIINSKVSLNTILLRNSLASDSVTRWTDSQLSHIIEKGYLEGT